MEKILYVTPSVYLLDSDKKSDFCRSIISLIKKSDIDCQFKIIPLGTGLESNALSRGILTSNDIKTEPENSTVTSLYFMIWRQHNFYALFKSESDMRFFLLNFPSSFTKDLDGE